MNFLKINKSNIILILLILFLSWILSCEMIYPYLSQKIPSCDKLIPFVLPIYICLFPIIVAVVTVVYQIHCTRYTLEDFQNDIKSRFWGLFSLSILGFSMTTLFWISGFSIKFCYFCSLATLVILFCKTISFIVNLNTISIEGYVEKFKNRCIRNLEKEKQLADYLEKCSRIIEHYFTESIERKESKYINCIIKAKVEIFKAYACKINFLLMNTSLNGTENERILSIFAESLTKSFIYLSENNLSKSIKIAYARCFIDVCYSCIECQNKILFEALINKLSGNAIDLEMEDFTNVLKIMCTIQEESLKKKKDEYAQIVEKNFINSVGSSRFIEKYKANKANLLISYEFLHNKISYSTEDSFKELLSSFIDAIIDSSDNFDVNEALFFSYVIRNTLKDLEQKKFEDSYVCFLDGLERIIRRAILQKNKNVLQIVGNDYLDVVRSKLNKKNYITDTELLFLCLKRYPSEVFAVIPDYGNWLKEHDSIEDLKIILNLFTEIVNCIDKKENTTTFTFFLNSVNEGLSYYCEIKQDDDKKIIAIVEWYKNIILRCIQENENLAYDLAISMFYTMLVNVEKQNAISDNVAEKILVLVDDVGIMLMETNDFNVQRKFVDMIYNLIPDKINYCRKDAKGIMRISDIIFHFIIDSLQAGHVESLKICSNALGWYALSLSKMGNFDCYKKTVDYAFLMIELAVSQKCDNRTILFLGTLVVVLGTFLNIHKHTEYETYLIKKVKDSDKKIQKMIVASKKFRYYEAAYWDDLLDGNARNGMDAFMNNFAELSISSCE